MNTTSAKLEERMKTAEAKYESAQERMNASLERFRADMERMRTSVMIWIAIVGGLVVASTGLIIALVTGLFGDSAGL